MPLPLLTIAIPVLHASGGWIASTAATGYLAGTLSGTWIGAFVLGNSSLLSGLGLISAAGLYGAASSGLAALAGGAATGASAALAAVGLGGVANALGIAPVATFLGLTPAGWAIAGGAGVLAVTLGSYFTLRIMRELNEEREKGGLEPITLLQILEEVEVLESESMQHILERLEKEISNLSLSDDRESVAIDGETYTVARLKYIMNEDGSEEIHSVPRIGKSSSILQIKAANEVETGPSHPGDFIRNAVLKAHELDEAGAAKRLGMDLTGVCDLLDGKSAISPELALRMEEEFGLNMEMLLHMQAVHSAAQMRRERRRQQGPDSSAN